jgi:hypothetical protein
MAVYSLYNFQTPESEMLRGVMSGAPCHYASRQTIVWLKKNSIRILNDPQWNTRHTAGYHSEPQSPHTRTRIFMQWKHLEDKHMFEQKIDGERSNATRTRLSYFFCLFSSLAQLVKWLLACLDDRGSTVRRDFPLQCIQTGSGAHPFSCSVCI